MFLGLSRDVESAAVCNFLDAVNDGAAGLVIEGEPGIGKTTLWVSALEDARARGCRVLSARPGPHEVSLTYGVVADLLGAVESTSFATLPDGQRGALDGILLGAEPYAPANERLVGAAFVSVVERLAADAPVVVAVDDVHWLDTSSLAVLAFAARRLTGRVGILAAVRSDAGYAQAASWVQLTRPDAVSRVGVTPLSLGAVHSLVSTRLGRSLPRPDMTRIHAMPRGNPLYAPEIGSHGGRRTQRGIRTAAQVVVELGAQPDRAVGSALARCLVGRRGSHFDVGPAGTPVECRGADAQLPLATCCGIDD